MKQKKIFSYFAINLDMMKKILAITLLAGLCSFILVEYQKVKPGKGVSMEIPSSFAKMDESSIIRTFLVHRLPVAVYTDGTGDVSISVNIREDSLMSNPKTAYKGSKMEETAKDPTIEKLFLKSGLYNTFKNIEFIKDSVGTLDDNEAIFFEFVGDLEGVDAKGNPELTRNYNYIIYGYRKTKTYIFSFAAPFEEKAKWQPVAHHIMQSISF